jgi:hypothetical protein
LSSVLIVLQLCRRLESELSGGRTHFVETCGLPMNQYLFQCSEVIMVDGNVDAVKDAVPTGDALFGTHTIDTWFVGMEPYRRCCWWASCHRLLKCISHNAHESKS